MENKKPISEWTLKEVQEMCDNQDDCPGCTFYTAENGCMFCGEATGWPLGNGEAVCAATVEYIHYPAAATEAPDKPAKPRLAEVLGVEEDEEWTFPGSKETYRAHNWILESKLQSPGPGAPGWPWTKYGYEEVCNIINHPESIIRAPRLTEAERAICKALGAKWVTRDEDGNPWAKLWDEKPDVEIDRDNGRCYYSESGASLLALVDGNIFKSVHPGDCICVEEADSE